MIQLTTNGKAAHADATGLVLEDLCFEYGCGSCCIQVPSLSIGAGDVHCLTGPSGAGKSTLLRLIAGLQSPRSGTIRIHGRSVWTESGALPPERRRVGLVFQDFQLFPHLSALGNVLFSLREGTRRERRARGLRMLDALGLADRAGAKPHKLSGGEQQRVAVARALAMDPHVMLLDEPFRSLDPDRAASTRETVVRAVRDSGVPTLVVTHDLDEAELIADKVWTLAVPAGSPRAVLSECPEFGSRGECRGERCGSVLTSQMTETVLPTA